jgi:hypothetical protein
MLYEEFPALNSIDSDYFDLTAEVEGETSLREEGYLTVLSTIRRLNDEKYIRLQGYSIVDPEFETVV